MYSAPVHEERARSFRSLRKPCRVRGSDLPPCLIECAQRIARPTTAPVVRIRGDGDTLADGLQELFDAWWSVTPAMQRLRDNPDSADQERAAARCFDAPPLQPKLSFDPADDIAAPYINLAVKPRVAILREQGVNGQIEMASAFVRAGFSAVDVHMSDLIGGRARLEDFAGFAACGGFSSATCSAPAAVGRPRSWNAMHCATRSLAVLRAQRRFALGVCNGCQMLAQLRHHSRRGALAAFLSTEANSSKRVSACWKCSTRLPLFFGHGRLAIPVAIAHGEGRAAFDRDADAQAVSVALRYVGNDGAPAAAIRQSNGSTEAIAGLLQR